MGLIEIAAPFRTPLLEISDTGVSPNIRRLEGLPGQIVRVDDYHADEADTEHLSSTPSDVFLAGVRSTDNTLSFYRRNGIAIPDYYRTALVRFNGAPVLYTIVDEVVGRNIGSGIFTSRERNVVTAAVDRTYARFIQIADYVFFHGGCYLFGLGLDQFVWGKPAGGKIGAYYVDLDPESSSEIIKFSGEVTEKGEDFLVFYMRNFIDYTESAEEKFGRVMSSARREFLAFCRQFDETEYDHYAEDLLDRLYRRK